MNGVYLRAMTPEDRTPTRSSATCASRGSDWDERTRPARPRRSSRRRSRGSASSRRSPASSSGGRAGERGLARRRRATCSRPPRRRSRAVEPFTAEPIEAALRALAERLGLKPRKAFQPIRIAVTGSKVSPGPVREHRAARPRRVARPAQRCEGGRGLGRPAGRARAGRARPGGGTGVGWAADARNVPRLCPLQRGTGRSCQRLRR